MFKFLYSTDWHYKGKSPSTRTDHFPSTMEAKIKHFFWLGHELGVDAFLHGGDYFDSPYISDEHVIRLGNIIEQSLKGKQLYGIWGNHDVTGWNPNTVTRTAIGVFQNFSPYFTILNRTPIVLEKKGYKVKLTGVSSYAELDRHQMDADSETIVNHRSRDYVIEESDGTPHIHIVHGYLSPKPILDNIVHTVIDEMRHTRATVTLTGHEHTGFPVTKINHGLVYNPGALGRVFASHTEMNRMPKYALITIHDDGLPEIEPIPCPVAQLGSEVMNREELDRKAEKEARLREAKGDIKQLLKELNIQGIDLRMVLEGFRDKVEPDVYELAEQYLGL